MEKRLREEIGEIKKKKAEVDNKLRTIERNQKNTDNEEKKLKKLIEERDMKIEEWEKGYNKFNEEKEEA